MPKVVIIGGGLHGTSIFINLPSALQKQTLIIDTGARPLELFFSRCQNVGMKYLRSPASHMMKEPLSAGLIAFTKQYRHLPNSFEGRYFTPSLSLFKEHTEHVLHLINWNDHWHQDVVNSLQMQDNRSWVVGTEGGSQFSASHVILALGMGDQYISTPFENIAATKHVLHKNFSPIHNSPSANVVVIGGGMSGAQHALQLSKYHRVSLIVSKPLEESFFDSNPCFIGPKCRNTFIHADSSAKIHILHTERFKGTVNPYVFKQLRRALDETNIQLHIARVEVIKQHAKQFEILLTNNTSLLVDDLVLATGFMNKSKYIQSSQLLTNFVDRYKIALNTERMPLLANKSLEIAPNVFVSGALAEMTLGPPSNNIIGAHLFCRTMKHIWKKW